jgi:hypothetical protein
VPSLRVQTQTLARQPSATLPPEKDKIKDNLGEFFPFTRTSSQKPPGYDPIMPNINKIDPRKKVGYCRKFPKLLTSLSNLGLTPQATK